MLADRSIDLLPTRCAVLDADRGCNTGVREVRRSVEVAEQIEQQAIAVAPATDDWPGGGWHSQHNEVDMAALPTHWSASDNVRWKTSIPGRGRSSSSLRVGITSFPDRIGRRTTNRLYRRVSIKRRVLSTGKPSSCS